MKRNLTAILLAFTWVLAAFAQGSEPYNRKSTYKQVKSYWKAENYSKIDELLSKAFAAYAEARSDAKLLNYELNAQYEMAKQENTKLFLGNKPDTAAYFGHVYKVYQYALQVDSVGKTLKKNPFSTNVSNKLTVLRNNLRSGGKFHYQKKQYSEAFNFFDMYLKTIGLPSLQTTSGAYQRAESPLDADSVEIATFASMAAFSSQKYPEALRYKGLALSDSAHREAMLSLTADAYLQLKDTANWLQTLHQAFDEYPQSNAFYPQLIDYYDSIGNDQAALKVVDRLIETNRSNADFWKLRGKLCEGVGDYDSAIKAYQSAILLNQDDSFAYASMGDVYLQQAHQFYSGTNPVVGTKYYDKNKSYLKEIYQQARKAFEKSRALNPENTTLWKSGLREVYFKLNLGKELRKLEKLK